MIRNLMLKLPSLTCTSEYALSSLYRPRGFRSLSPIQRLRPGTSPSERSLSCSRVERRSPVNNEPTGTQSRSFCFSKEYYANENHEEREDEAQWRENPPMRAPEKEKPDETLSYPKQDNVQFETLEQYELEAAKPRPSKSRELIDAFNSKTATLDRYGHLQPNQMKPYGSADNFYCPFLIRPTNSIKYPRRFKRNAKKDNVENESNMEASNTNNKPSGQRSFCTSTSERARRLSTSKSCITKAGHNTNEAKPILRQELKFPQPEAIPRSRRINMGHWSTSGTVDFVPRSFQQLNEWNETIETSTAAMRQQRKDAANRNGSVHYKPSYSDLIKLKIKEARETVVAAQNCPTRPAKITEVACKSLVGRRTFTTKSKSNLTVPDNVAPSVNQQREYSKRQSKCDEPKKPFRCPDPKKPPKCVDRTPVCKPFDKKRDYNPDCENVCTPFVKSIVKSKKPFPYEPAKCETESTANRKVYLPSKVKLPVPECVPPPEYRDCKKEPPCPDRADDCLIMGPKKLPKLVPSDCPCIDTPPPTINPKLEKLCFKFEDPPKVVCHPPPCDTPRADDSNPYKFKPLKPYVPGDCACVEPPPMVDVKMKRLPKCAPEEICRPVRICPVPEPCSPRADRCYKVVPKKLPIIFSKCPCVDPPQPTIAPPIKRLDLYVPEPERVCPQPPPCPCPTRADCSLKEKKKKLPKFVPGDCPCEDRPMTDWNLKRLVCEDEPQDCIVPDPCKAFPRADWGCWEYPDEVCEIVDEKCIDNRDKCVKPKKKECRKKSICETGAGLLDYRHVPKREFSNSSLPLDLYEKHKTNNAQQSGLSYNNPEENVGTRKPLTIGTKMTSEAKKLSKKSSLELIKKLNQLELTDKCKANEILFYPQKKNKLDFEKILRSIDSATAELRNKSTNPMTTHTLKKHKTSTLEVSSRAISTTEQMLKTVKNESDIKMDRDCEAKRKCKKLKPTIKALMCKRKCPRYKVCPSPGQEHRPGCSTERIPVCCEKKESPYSSFSDKFPDTIQPFTTATPQWTCNRQQYGFHPINRKEHDPLDRTQKKEKKSFSTSTLLGDLPFPPILKKPIVPEQCRPVSFRSKSALNYTPTKGFLRGNNNHKSPTLVQHRTFTTKIFQIKKPVVCNKPKTVKCDETTDNQSAVPKIVCQTEEVPCVAEKRRCCYREYSSNSVRKSPPFPSFSDCLDEEMEDILTECPLDREKYLVMQPRFMNPPPKPTLLTPPPPNQGKIDILKEQECLREKFCMDNVGVTQSCTDFGNPVPLMKTKKMVVEENWDCKRMEELKKIGRWPPFTLKSNRRFSTLSTPIREHSYGYSTYGFNTFPNAKNCPAKGIYVRDYHALVKGVKKPALGEDEKQRKEASKEGFPLEKKSNKYMKCKNNSWRIHNLKTYQRLHKNRNIAQRVRRYYTMYKRQPGNRNFSTGCTLLSSKVLHFRGRRYHKNKSKRPSSKFTLSDTSSAKVQKNRSGKRILITPYVDDVQTKTSSIYQPETCVKEYPCQDKIDHSLSMEYYKCKHNIPNEGLTLNCETFKDYFNPKLKKLQREKEEQDIEVRLQRHKQDTGDNQVYDGNGNANDNVDKKIDECMCKCLKSIPCHLPEEEKICICKEPCTEELCEPKTEQPEKQKVEEQCEPPPPPAPPCNIPKELETTVCDEVAEPPPPPPTLPCNIPKELDTTVCDEVAEPPPTPPLTPPSPPPPPSKTKSLTQLENLWQRIVNYFKARPNCPKPGDYKKRALKDKAEKAANAAGLVVVDPKCLPPELLDCVKDCVQEPKKECKICPNEDPCDKPTGTRSNSPQPNKRNFSTNYQPFRNYSKDICSKNLAEINRMLEESEMEQRRKKFVSNNGIAMFTDRKDLESCEALKMSLDKELRKFVDLYELCDKDKRPSRTYFGYSGIIPSRENILERAWRITIEAYNRYNYPRSFHFFNEIFVKVENTIKSADDLEKLKTENVLRELEQYLNKDDSKNKK